MNVLISSAGRRVGLLRIFQRALGRVEGRGAVFAADASPAAPCAFLADGFFCVPRCGDSAYIPTLLDLCRRESIGLVVPTIDTELTYLASSRDAFEQAGVSVAVSSLETVERCADKAASHDWLESEGFPVPPQVALRRGATIPDAVAARGPLVAKPRFGSSAVGVSIVDHPAAVAAFVAREDSVVEEFLRGDEYTVNVYVDRSGDVHCAVPHRRIAVRGGEVSQAVTAKRDDVMRLASSIAERLPAAYGPVNVQIFACTDGALRVTEINPRFSGGYPLAERAGARFADWLIQEAAGEALGTVCSDWQDGVSMSRFDTEVFFDAGGQSISAIAERAEGSRA